MNRNILYFCSLSSLDTGMPICTSRLVSHFSKLPGYTVHVILPEEGAFSDLARNSGATVTIVPFVRLKSWRHPVALAQFILSWPLNLVRIAAAIKRARPSVVHFSDFIDAPYYPAAAMAGCRAIAHLRLNIESPWARLFFRVWSRLFVDNVICISKSTLRHSGLPEKRATVLLDPGPEPAMFNPSNPVNKNSSLKGDRIVITSIAKFLKVKGHHHFVAMAAQLEQTCPDRFQYCIVGDCVKGHEAYFAEIQDLIAANGLSEKILVLGQIPHKEIPGALSQTHIFIHAPHYQEGLGGVVLEAMAMGRPVVAFNSGGVRECFEDGVSGLLVPQFDIQGLANAVIKLADDSNLRHEIGRRARSHVLEAFNPEKHFAAISRIYESLAANKLERTTEHYSLHE